MNNWYNTETRRRGLKLVEYLKAKGPEYTTWSKIGAECGFPFSISSVVSVVRMNPDRYGGTIAFVELGPTTHLIGYSWHKMPQSFALRFIAAQIVTEIQSELRHATRALVDSHIASAMGDKRLAERSRQMYELHRDMITS